MAIETSDHILITASRVEGTPVFNGQGDRIGHIEDLSIDKVSGKVRYALLSFGGFLGVAARIHPIPWDVLNYDLALEGYVVNLTHEELDKAPSYGKDELEGFGAGDQVYRDRLFSYYGQYGAMPYWGL
jgi:sporulation protein YlmC with PRC-barrel domain